MRRIAVPDGVDPVAYVMTHIGSPRLLESRLQAREAQYLNDSALSPREREGMRTRFAYELGCSNCVDWRPATELSGFSSDVIEEGFYANIFDPAWAGYSERERAAIQFADRFCSNFDDLVRNDQLWSILNTLFSEAELIDMVLLATSWDSLTRSYRLLVGEEAACATP